MRYHELYEALADINGNAVSLMKNPSPDLLIFFIGSTRRGIARGALIGQDAYFFDACLASHEDVQEYFGVPVVNDGFDVAEIEEGERYLFASQESALDHLLAAPPVRHAISDPRIHIAREDGMDQQLVDRLGRF